MIQTETLTETLSFATLVKDTATYNHWANTTLLESLRKLSPEQLEQPVASSFPSLKETLVHIWDVERHWLSVLKRETPEPSFRMGKPYDGTLEALFDDLLNTAADMAAYLNSLSDEDLQETCSFLVPVRWPEFDEFYRPRFEIVHHTLNHSTYHRGQLVTIARNVGATELPMTDYMYYLLMAKGL